MNRGKLVGFNGSWGSGIAQLVIEDLDGNKLSIPCDNAPTVRALESAFGDVIQSGHTADSESFEGSEVYWDYDELGLLLGWFMPVDDAPEELHDYYNNLCE